MYFHKIGSGWGNLTAVLRVEDFGFAGYLLLLILHCSVAVLGLELCSDRFILW